jgi:putative ABC transport system ATP-binding protein
MKALEMVGLADRVHHTPNQLSGGQQQRVAIARALVTDPPLLLADEPTGNLDTRTSLEVLALLQKLNRENGITIALVTHEHDIAACASRVITVRDGKIVSDVVQEEGRLDAAAALAALPPPQVYETDAGPVSLSPRERLRQKLGGPIPISLYAAMFGAGLGGALLGAAYDGLVLGQRVAWVVALAMVVCEAWAGARLGAKRQLGKPLTTDQRGRVAIVYTCAVTLPIAALVLALAVNKLPLRWLDGVEHLSSGGVALALLTSLVALGALSLLRFLLLSLFAPRVRAEPASVASEAP